VRSNSPVNDHILTSVSSEQVAKWLPDDQTRSESPRVCPFSTAVQAKVDTFQTRAVMSAATHYNLQHPLHALARCSPSEENLREEMLRSWPFSVPTNVSFNSLIQRLQGETKNFISKT
jgi:hypothetical protein